MNVKFHLIVFFHIFHQNEIQYYMYVFDHLILMLIFHEYLKLLLLEKIKDETNDVVNVLLYVMLMNYVRLELPLLEF